MSSKTYSTLRETLGEATAFVVGLQTFPWTTRKKKAVRQADTSAHRVASQEEFEAAAAEVFERHEELLRRLAQ